MSLYSTNRAASAQKQVQQGGPNSAVGAPGGLDVETGLYGGSGAGGRAGRSLAGSGGAAVRAAQTPEGGVVTASDPSSITVVVEEVPGDPPQQQPSDVAFGRPDIRAEIARLAGVGGRKAAGSGLVAVLACGPESLVSAAELAAGEHGFAFHKGLFHI